VTVSNFDINTWETGGSLPFSVAWRMQRRQPPVATGVTVADTDQGLGGTTVRRPVRQQHSVASENVITSPRSDDRRGITFDATASMIAVRSADLLFETEVVPRGVV
jgi:hypothetical protein